MVLSPACAGIAPACAVSPHELRNCRSAQLFHRRSIFVRHLGSRSALGSRKGLCSQQADVRPAMPRQGRLMCQARQAQVLGTGRRQLVRSQYACTRLQLCLQNQNPFRHSREMDGVQKTLANLPGAVFYGAALLLITAAGALGYSAGARAPGSTLHLPCQSCSLRR